MTSSPADDLSQGSPLGCRFNDDLLAAAAFANGARASVLSQSRPISSRATSDCASAANHLQAAFAESSQAGSVAFSAYSRAEAASLDAWLTARLDSIEMMLNRRCDGLESRLGVLTGAIYGDGSGFQRQIEALDFKLEAAQTKWEVLLGSLRSEVSADRATLSALADALSACEKGRESLQRGLDEMRQLLFRDSPEAPGNQGQPGGLAPRLQRLMDKVERTCTDLSGKISEEVSAPQEVRALPRPVERHVERHMSPALSQRSVSTSQPLGQTSLLCASSTAPSGQHGSVLPAARIHSSLLAASTLTPVGGADNFVVGRRTSQRDSIAEIPGAVVRRTSPQPSIGGSSAHSRPAARPRPEVQIAGSTLRASRQPLAAAARMTGSKEHLALV